MLPHHIDRIVSQDWPELAELLNKINENIESLVAQPGRNLRMTVGAKGFSIDGNPAAEAEGASVGLRGEWDPSFGTSYALLDIARISVGLEAGTYIAIEDIPAGDATKTPWTGNGWFLLGRINDQTAFL